MPIGRPLLLGFAAVLGLLAASGCAAPDRPAAADNATCAALLDQYDTYEYLPTPGFDFRQMQLAKIRQYRCITFTRQLEGMEAVAGNPPVARLDPGPRLARPIAIHAGVVTSDADAGRALAFFDQLGFRARAVGAPRLGTRIYVEARTAADVERIIALAAEAGFVGPYPSRYERF